MSRPFAGSPILGLRHDARRALKVRRWPDTRLLEPPLVTSKNGGGLCFCVHVKRRPFFCVWVVNQFGRSEGSTSRGPKGTILLYYTILYYTILYYTILYYTILYYTILYYTILYYTILYYTVLYYAMLCYAMLCYAMLCYVMPCHAILTIYHTIQHHTILCVLKCLPEAFGRMRVIQHVLILLRRLPGAMWQFPKLRALI